jgi:peptidoglycan/xylan/chitin deacetylase (PgdA/CDA1 family)
LQELNRRKRVFETIFGLPWPSLSHNLGLNLLACPEDKSQYAWSAFIGFGAGWEDLSRPVRNWLVRDQKEGYPLRLRWVGAKAPPGSLVIGSATKVWLIAVAMLLTLVLRTNSCPMESGASGVAVLVYHRIAPNRTPGNRTVISLERFQEQMQFLADQGFHTLKVSELLEFMKGYQVPEPSVVLTFDDGWKSVLKAVPILDRYGFKASFLIITACADGGGDYLTWSEIGQLAQNPNFEFGSHTVTHPCRPMDNLVSWIEGKTPGKGRSQVLLELKNSKMALESRLLQPIRYLAWPGGWYNNKLIGLAVEVGYEGLLTSDGDRANLSGDDIHRIRRVIVDGQWEAEKFAHLLRQAQSPMTSHERPAALTNMGKRGGFPQK